VPGETAFPDNILHQVWDVAPLIRRGRTQAETQGIYYAVLRNIHAAANTTVTSVEPYNQTIGNLPPFPLVVSRDFDIWLLGAAVRRESGTGTIAATVSVAFPASQQAFGEDSAGAAVAASDEHTLAFWDTIVVVGVAWAQLQEGGTWKRLAMRLPRATGNTIIFRSTSSALVTYDLLLTLGMFPVALGQDALA